MYYPYLPKSKVRVFIADCNIPDCTVIRPAELSMLPPSLRRHADLGICIVSSKKAVCPPDSCAYYKEVLSPYGIEIICGKTSLESNYPKDSAYNVGIVGKKCFLNKKVCDPVLLDILIGKEYEIIHVNQGYTKCSICPVDENSFITGDKSIADAGKKMGMDVLLITNDKISLDGYNNGFWGGCCGMGDKNLLLVNGDIATLPCGKEIKSFLDTKKILIQKLKEGKVTDIGSVLPLST